MLGINAKPAKTVLTCVQKVWFSRVRGFPLIPWGKSDRICAVWEVRFGLHSGKTTSLPILSLPYGLLTSYLEHGIGETCSFERGDATHLSKIDMVTVILFVPHFNI